MKEVLSYEQVEKGILDIYFSGIVCLYSCTGDTNAYGNRIFIYRLEWDRVREKICRTAELYHNGDG